MPRSALNSLLLALFCCVGSSVALAVELQTKIAPGDLMSYQIKLDVQGELKVPDGKKTNTLPLQVNGQLQFGGRRVDDASQANEVRTLRHYDEGRAVIRIDRESNIVKLRPTQALVRARVSSDKFTLLSANDPMSREERDLLDVPCDPLTLPGLLPAGPAQVNETWTIPGEKLAALLTLDHVKHSEVTGKISSTQNGQAELAFAGKLTGQALGAATAIELTGTASFNLKQGRFTAWNFKIIENRDPGMASPGMNLTAQVTGSGTPQPEIKALADETLNGLTLVDDQQQSRLSYTHRHAKYRMQYDARWRIMQDESQQLSMRLVDDGIVVAQANLKLLELPAEAPPMTSKEFESDIKAGLGNRFIKFQDSTVGSNPQGFRTLKVVAEGTVDGVAILWLSYLFEGPAGHRVAVTIALEDKLLDKFNEADRAILETIEFARVEAANEADPNRK